MDDSGTRKPDRRNTPFDPSRDDFFALGGVLFDEADKEAIDGAVNEFKAEWGIAYPLHSVEIRNATGNFTWLGADDVRERFMTGLAGMLTTLPLLGIASTVDRPGYDARYRAKYGRDQWSLCRTAFSVLVERAAKEALARGARLRVCPERASKDDDARLKLYYEALRETGMPFEASASSRYKPLAAEQFAHVLYEFKTKTKASRAAQIADLYLWPMAKAGYRPNHRPFTILRDAGRLIEAVLDEDQIAERGSKYSCFELVTQAIRASQTTKAQT